MCLKSAKYWGLCDIEKFSFPLYIETYYQYSLTGDSHDKNV